MRKKRRGGYEPWAWCLALLSAGAAAAYTGWQLITRARLERLNKNLPRGTRILIVGAGFAGTNAARELARLLPRPEHGQIILVDEDDYQLFTPMLTEAAGGEVKANSKDTYSPTAQNATREGLLVARNIVATLRGQGPKPFRYRPVGELALVGRHAGVARVYGFNFSGLPAWLLWRAVYWAKMPSGVQRVRILLDWLLDFAFGRPVAALPPSRQGVRDLPQVKR